MMQEVVNFEQETQLQMEMYFLNILRCVSFYIFFNNNGDLSIIISYIVTYFAVDR